MSQFDFGTINPDLKSGSGLASDLNSWRDALHSMHRGSTRPTYAVQGMRWIDDSATPWLIKMYNGASLGTDTVIGSYDQTTGAYTPVLSNNQVTPANMIRTGTAGQVLTSGGPGADPSYQPAPGVGKIQTIGASVAASALTVSAGDLSLDFRSTTLGSGTVSSVSGTPVNLVVPSGATLGTINAVQSQLVVIAMNNAGTIELAVVNLSGGNNLDETTLISTTAVSSAADAANVVYSTAARTNLPFRVIGLIQSTQATAGTWATAPSLIQGAGGQAIAAMGTIGHGQTWQDMIASRAVGTTYYNTTGRPITVSVRASISAGGSYIIFNCQGVGTAFAVAYGPGVQVTVVGIVPPGASYLVTQTGGTATLIMWAELR